MNKKGDIEKRDIFSLIFIYILLLSIVSSSTNISFQDNNKTAVTENISNQTLTQNETQDSVIPQNETNPPHPNQSINQTTNFSNEASQENNSYKVELTQQKAKVGSPVIWTKRVYTTDENYKIEIPKNAVLVEKEIFSIMSVENPEFIEVEYYTPAPESSEKIIPQGKEVFIYSQEHYANVSVSTKIPEEFKIRSEKELIIQWVENNTIIQPEEFIDTNNNGFYDYVSWIAPHLSNQTFRLIVITSASHLDEGRNFLENIYDSVYQLDDIWSPVISNEEFVRVTFEENLTSKNDITIFARAISGNPRIEVYEINGIEKIAEFSEIYSYNHQKIYLTNLVGSQDTFDLKIVDGSVEFDYIVDPYEITSQGFTTSTTWTVPPGITEITVETWGAGGAGGGAGGGGDQAGGGGGGGAYARRNITVSPGQQFTLTVATTSAGVSNGNGNPGGSSSLSNATATYVLAAGGDGGSRGGSGAGGAGGTVAASIGDIRYAGGAGSAGVAGSYGGAGGGGAGSTGDGGLANGATAGNGTFELGGDGGASLTETGNGNVGANYGGGGGGAIKSGANVAVIGGTGAQGYIRISYEEFLPIEIQVQSPINQTYRTNTIWFNATANDNMNTWIVNYNGTNITLSSINTTLTVLDGNYHLRLYANDSQNNWGLNDSIYFSVDTAPPLVTPISPIQDYYYTTSTINFQIATNKYATAEYTLDGGQTNYSMTPNATNTGFTDSRSLSDGAYTVQFFAEDLGGYLNDSVKINFTVDSSPPTANNIDPQNDTYSKNTEHNLTANFSDNYGLGNATIFILNSTGNVIYTNKTQLNGVTFATIGTVYNFTYNNRFSWFYNINDIAGNNYNSTPSIITIDTVNPVVNYISPTESDGQILLRDWIFINTSVIELNFENITFNLYNSSGQINQTTFTDSTQSINFTNLADGIYYYNVTVFDKATNIGSSSTRSITLDTTTPQISFSPSNYENDSVISSSEITLDVLVTEINEQNITFRLYNSTGSIIRESTFTDLRRTITWNLLSEGTYYYNVTVFDKVSLFNSTETRSITLDTTPPIINYVPATENNNANKSQNYIFINTSVTELNFQNITFNLYNSSGLINQTTFLDSTRSINFTNLADGIYQYNVTVFDRASQSDSTETRTITLDTIYPQIVYTFPTEENDTTWLRDYIFINTSVTELNFKQITFFLYGSSGLISQTTFTDSTRSINFTNLDDGFYYYNATAEDYSGNKNSTETRKIGLDQDGPIITIIEPESKTYGYNESLPLNHTVYDLVSAVDSCWYNLDNGANQTIDCNSPTTFNTTAGPHTLYIFANDTFGNIGSNSVSFSVSITGPAIELIAPSNDTFYSSLGIVDFNFTAEDPDGIEFCSLYGTWNDGWHKNDTYPVFSEQETSSYFSVEISEEDTYLWNIECNDSVGYYSFAIENFTFTFDLTNPQVFFGAGTQSNNTIVGRNWIFVDADVIETNFKNITFNLYNSSGQVRQNTFTDSTRQINWTNLISGTYEYNITVFDKASRVGYSTTRTIHLDLIPPKGELISPPNNTYANSLIQNLTANFSDPSGLLSATLYVLNATGSIIYSQVVEIGGSFSATVGVVYNFIQDGIYYWFYSVTDMLGNQANITANTLIIDTTPPQISYSIGVENSGLIMKRDYIFVNVTILDINFQNVTFNLYDSSGQIRQDTFTDSTRQINWTLLGDGVYYYNVTAYDKAGNKNSTETRTVTLDNTAPIVEFSGSTKQSGSYISGESITLDVTVTEPNEQNITFRLYNSAGSIIRENTFTDQRRTITWNLLSEGTYYYNVTVFDKVNLSGSTETRTITLDGTPPIINYGPTTMQNNSYANQNWIYVDAIVTELNFQNITFYLYNQSGEIANITFLDSTRNYNFTSLVNGVYYYNITTHDKASNTASTLTRQITLDTIYPQIVYASPTEQDNFNKTSNWIYINTSIIETNFANITFSLYDSNSLINQTTYDSQISYINFTNLESKFYWYNVTVKDKASNQNFTETRKITIDYVGPVIQITSPQPISYSYNESIPLNYTVTDELMQPSMCWYNLDNTANITVDCSTNTTFNVTDGPHTLHFYSNDTLGNLGYKNVTFLISVTGPTINLLNPEDNTFYSQATEVFFNYTAEDPDLTETCSLYGTWNGGWHLNQTDYNWIIKDISIPLFNNFEGLSSANLTSTGWAIASDRAIGTYSFKCGTAVDCDLSSNVVANTSVADYVNVSFYYNDRNCDPGDAILYFNNSAGSWVTIANVDAGSLGQADNVWNYYEIVTTNPDYFHPGFAIRIEATPDAGGGPNAEEYWVDNIRILYEENYNKDSGNFTVNLSSEGSYDWNVYCNDTIGYVTSAVSNYTFAFDVTDPIVNFATGTLPDNSNVSQNYIYINSTVIETNFANITFYLYNETSRLSSQTFYDSTRSYNFTNLQDGRYYYNITVFDYVSRSNSTETRTILLDTTPPQGELISPSDGSISNNAIQNLTASFSDLIGLKEAILFIFNSTGLIYSETISLSGALTATVGILYEFLTDGIYQWLFQVEDITGNLHNTTNNTITIDTTLPQINFINLTLENNSYVSQDYIYINTSVIEINFKNITFDLYNSQGLYSSNTFTTSRRDINYTLLPDGIYFYNVTVWDQANNINTSETRVITLDNIFPVINYVSPTEVDYANKSQNYIYINTSLIEENFANITFKLYYQGVLENQTTYDTRITNINFTNLADGLYTYNVTTTDKTGKTSNLPTRTIRLDTTNPIIFFISPTEDSGSFLEQSNISMSVFLTEANLANITYYLYNSTGTLINQTTYQTATTQNIFPASSENKTYFYNVTAIDVAGNKASTATRNITLIDITYPTLNIISPENRTYPYNTSIRVEYEAFDIHLDSCWYNLNFGTNITLPNCQYTFLDVEDEQTHTITIFANDTLGYTTSRNVTFFVNSSLLKIPESYYVQRGSVFLDGLATSSINEVNPRKSFIIHTTRSSSNSPRVLQTTSDLIDSEEVIFKNYESGSGAVIEYSIIEGPEIFVERGEIAYTTENTIGMNILEVNLSNTFIILNNRLNSSLSAENIDGFWSAGFTNSSHINFSRGNNNAQGTLSYQIVTWENSSVQSINSTIPDSQNSIIQEISQINENKSFMVFSRSASGSTSVQNSMIRGEMINSSHINFSRVGSSGEIGIESFIIENDIFRSNHKNYTHQTTSSPQYDNIPKPLLNLSRSFDIHSNDNAGASTSFSTAYLTQNIYNKTSIVLQKGVSTGAGTTSWSTIEITESDPPIINLTYPVNYANISTQIIPYFNFTVEDESEIQNCSLYGNWSSSWHENQTIQEPQRNTNVNFSSVMVEPDNYYTWAVKCIDIYGNEGVSVNFSFAMFLPAEKPIIYNITQSQENGFGEITLFWNASNHTQKYIIYAGQNPNSLSYESETTDLNYTDDTFAGEKRKFYQVSAWNPVSQNSSDLYSAHLYTLRHNTITMRNWISFPINIGYIKNANESLNKITNATDFTQFNATTQRRVTCNEFSCPESFSCTNTNCNFEIEPGRGYEVNINSSVPQQINWSAVGKTNEALSISLVKNTTSFGKNWISLNADTSITNAQGLVLNIPNSDAITRWNATAQRSEGLIPSPFPWIPGFIGNNFQVNLEEAYEVSVTTSGIWNQ